MAKLTKRLNIKGQLDLANNIFTEFDKDLGEITHNLTELLSEFDLVDEVTLSASSDSVVTPE